MIRSSAKVTVRAPCRLHFGMLSFGDPSRRQHGGLGVALRNPAVELTIEPAPRFEAKGDLAGRVTQFARRAAESWQLAEMPPCSVRVTSAPPTHVGLGVGTQLAIAVAAGLRRFLSLPDASVGDLAQSVGRAQRSSVGSYAFGHGGMILEAGKVAGETIGPLIGRVEIPTSWRWVLIRPSGKEGLSGKQEVAAFDRLPAVSGAVADSLRNLAEDVVLPSAAEGRFATFAAAVYRYGIAAGHCFAAAQGGPFASAAAAETVETLRGWGIEGVGQSSWGPTIFAATESESQAQSLVDRLARASDTWRLTIAATDNAGGEVCSQSLRGGGA